MLRFLRRYSQSTGIKVLYMLLAVVFVFWGAGMLGMSRLDTVAQVYGDRITQTDLARETQLMQRQLEALARGAQIAGLDLRAQALDALIEQALLRHEADRLGLTVTEDDVVRSITTMPELQRGGRFDRDLLERILRQQRDRGEFESEVRQDILQRRFRDLVLDGVQLTPAEIEAEYRRQNEQVSLLYVRIASSDAAATVELGDEALEAYRTAHRDRYLTQPTTRARYVVLKPGDYAAEAAPSPAQIEAYYEAHRADRFTRPEQVHARHILVRVAPDASDADRAAARKRAEDLLARVRAGEDFATLAKEHSDDPGSASQGGDLGTIERGRMVPAFETALFSLAPGEVSDVVETPFGYHVIKVESHDPGGPQDLAAVRDQIVATLTHDRGMELARREADRVRRAVVGGKTLADAAAPHALAETPPFAEGAVVEGVGRVPDFVQAAFALDEGQVSDLVEGEDAVYILQPFDRHGPELPPLADIRERVLADARRDAGEAKAKERANALLARARQVGLATAAAEAGLETQRTGLFARRAGSIPTLGSVPALTDAAFALTSEAPLAPDAYTVSGDAVVAALAERKDADMAGLEADRAAIEESLLQRKRTEAFGRYVDLLKRDALERGKLRVRTDALARS